MATPADRKYAASHEWIKLENGIATVGITDHAQDALGDITFIELPKMGAKLVAGKECCVIESVKAASDIYAPVAGVVCEVNTAVEASPETVNQDPWEAGWIFKISGVDEAALAGLMDAAAYEGSCA